LAITTFPLLTAFQHTFFTTARENYMNSQYVENWNEKTLAVGKTTKRKQVEQPGIYI
jgi:hypothetical protein